MKKKKGFIEEYKEGLLLEDLKSDMKLVLEHVVEVRNDQKSMKRDIREINEKLDTIEIKLVGKADSSRVDRIEKRVTGLEHRI